MSDDREENFISIKLTKREFLKLPIEIRRREMERQAKDPELIKYYEEAMLDEWLDWKEEGKDR